MLTECSRKSMKPLRNTAANRVHWYTSRKCSRRFMTWNNPTKICTTRALCDHVSQHPTQISHLGLVLILRDENSIYKRARYYAFKGLKHSTAIGIASCATATWHFTLQLTRIRLSWTPFSRKSQPEKPTAVPFHFFVLFIQVNRSVL